MIDETNSPPSNAADLYTDGAYAAAYPDWHLEGSVHKVDDIFPALLEVISRLSSTSLRLADVGAGVGGVLAETVKRLQQERPTVSLEPRGLEISQFACAKAKELFPHIPMRQKLLEPSDGPFDVVMFIDVLEHVENPWDLLRTAHKTAQFMVVRQPLLESFSTFRHDNYSVQRQTWGHIAYFNYRSFLDMAHATGWKPFHLSLDAAWELSWQRAHRERWRIKSLLSKLMVRCNRIMASHFLPGFYLNGAFERAAS